MRRRKKKRGKRNEMLATVVFGTDKCQYHCQSKSGKQQTADKSQEFNKEILQNTAEERNMEDE